MKLITRIHQIEITSRCNLRCKYCVHPHMKREKMDMPLATFEAAMYAVDICVKRYGQTELNLCGIGESTQHPHFLEYIDIARSAFPNLNLVLASNGVGVTENQIEYMAGLNISLGISLHRPEKAGLAIELAKKYNILKFVSADPSLSATNWAGQVDWFVSCGDMGECPWLKEGKAMITSNGDLTTCSLDGDGAGVIGSLNTYLETDGNMYVQPYRLCKTCHHKTPKGA